MATRPLICRDIFDFSSVTAEQDSTKLDRKQDLNVVYQFCVIRADKKGRPGLWLAETFSTSPLWPLNRIQRNLTWNKISTSASAKFVLFDETWLEARYQRPLQSLCFSGRMKNKMAAPDSDWLRHFRLLFWTEFNKSWPEIRYMCMSTPSFKFVIFGPIGKTTICGPWASYLCIK